jgi:hypothetical protein
MTKQEFIDKHFRGCSPEYFDIVSSDLDAVIAGSGEEVNERAREHFVFNCIDPLFEIKGCDMPKGSCKDCTPPNS